MSIIKRVLAWLAFERAWDEAVPSERWLVLTEAGIPTPEKYVELSSEEFRRKYPRIWRKLLDYLKTYGRLWR